MKKRLKDRRIRKIKDLLQELDSHARRAAALQERFMKSTVAQPDVEMVIQVFKAMDEVEEINARVETILEMVRKWLLAPD